MPSYQHDVFGHGGAIDGSGIEMVVLLGKDVLLHELTVDFGCCSVFITNATDDKGVRCDRFDVWVRQLVDEYFVFRCLCETVVVKGPTGYAAVECFGEHCEMQIREKLFQDNI